MEKIMKKIIKKPHPKMNCTSKNCVQFLGYSSRDDETIFLTSCKYRLSACAISSHHER